MRSFLFIPLVCLSFACFAQNNLRLSSKEGLRFTIYISDTSVNKKPQAEVLVKNVDPDTLTVKVELENKQAAAGTLYFLEKGKSVKNKEFNYALEVKNGKIKFEFTGSYPIHTLPDPLVPKKPVIDTTYKLRNNMYGHYCELKEGKVLYFNNLPPEECLVPMPSTYVGYMNFLMKRAQTDDDKYSVAENTCRNNCISITQLNRILFHIPYEIEKIRLIKIAYYNITDKSNKSALDSTFKLESSKKELASFFKEADENKPKTGAKCAGASTQAEISKLISSLSVYNNDAAKFAQLKKIYAEYCYTVEDVKLILKNFIHDREKLDIAKLLYFYCVNKDKFMETTEVFSYNTTAADLKDFIGKQKN